MVLSIFYSSALPADEVDLDLDENELQLLLESEDEEEKPQENIAENKIKSKADTAEPCQKKAKNSTTITEPEFPVITVRKLEFSPQKQAPTTPQKAANGGDSENGFSNLSSLELIFLGYAKTLQKMPLPLQLKAKRKIANVLDEAELEMFELQD